MEILKEKLEIKGRALAIPGNPEKVPAPGLPCLLRLHSLAPEGMGIDLQPDSPGVEKLKFEKSNKTNASRGGEAGKFQFSGMPYQVKVDGITYFAVYTVEVRNLGKAVVGSRNVNAQNASLKPGGLQKSYELLLDLDVDKQLLVEPFERSKDVLTLGGPFPLADAENIGLDLNDKDGNLYDFYVAVFEGQDQQVKTRLQNELFEWPEDKRADWKKDFDGTSYEFVAKTASDFFWRTPKARISEPVRQFSNDGFEWLTYETVLNNPKFRKSNQPLDYGLYTLPCTDVEVFLRNRVPHDVLAALADAFFPDHEPGEVQAASNAHWPWKNSQYTSSVVNTQHPQSPTAVQLSGVGGIIADADLRVVLPYNYFDNTHSSLALGTDKDPLPNAQQIKFSHDKKWKFWKTASRSSVVKLQRVKDKDADWKPLEEPAWKIWPFWKGVDERFHVKLATDVAKGNALKTAGLSSSHVSLKTGVCYVGTNNQGASKQRIDGNWIVSILRSDFVVETEALVGKRDDRLLVLTELLSMTEKTTREKSKDGVQVRDLSPLLKDRAYIFPGSIPYIGTDYKSLTTAYAAADNADWCAFWQHHWVAGLGKAKALFLLQYGLQHINPNPQNYLIEFRKGPNGLEPLSRIIIRDLQDAALHREVVWTLYVDPQKPVEPSDDRIVARPLLEAAFKDAAERSTTKPCIAHILQREFEVDNEDGFQETGTPPEGFDGVGARLSWATFSANVSFTKDDWLTALENEVGSSEKMDRVINLLAGWGLAHAISYVRTIEEELGVEFSDIRWVDFPNFNYRNETVTEDTIVVVEYIQKFLASSTPLAQMDTSGQQAIRDYRSGKWNPVRKPVKILELHDGDLKRPPWRIVQFKSPSKTWWRPTGANGCIPVFKEEPYGEVTSFELLRWTGKYRRVSPKPNPTWERVGDWESVKRLVLNGTILQV